MYIDTQNQVWLNPTALTTTAVSTNAIDCHLPYTTSATQPDPSVGVIMGLVVHVVVVGLHAGTETYEFQVITATASDLTTGQLVIATGGTIATADVAVKLAAGAKVIVPIPPGSITQQFLGAKFVGANSSGVSVTGEIVPLEWDLELQKYYSTAITVH